MKWSHQDVAKIEKKFATARLSQGKDSNFSDEDERTIYIEELHKNYHWKLQISFPTKELEQIAKTCKNYC
jgi:hypothetical protein